MADAIRALRPAVVRGALTLWNMSKDKSAKFRNDNDVCLANALCDVERQTGHLVYMEYLFHPTRKWRFDACVPSVKVAVEVEGIPVRGGKSRHLTIGGFLKDKEKYTAAEVMGWHVLRFVWKDVRDGSATKQIVECVNRLKGG